MAESVHFRIYEQPVGSCSLLTWAVRRLIQSTGGDAHIAVLAPAPDAQRATNALRLSDHTVTIETRSALGDLHDASELAVRTAVRRVVVLDLTHAILPQHSFELALRAHIEHGGDLTTLTGLPVRTEPAIVEADALRRATHHLPDTDLAAWMSSLGRDGGGWRPDKLQRFAPVSVEEQATRRWPHAVQLQGREDVAVLRHAVASIAAEPDTTLRPPDVLDRWVSAALACDDLYSTTERQRTSRVLTPTDRHHVLYAQTPSGFSGVEEVLRLLAVNLRDQPWECRTSVLIAQEGVLTDELTKAGVDVCIANRDFSRATLSNVQYCTDRIRRISPTLVHAHAIAGFPLCVAAADRGIPVLQHVHVASAQQLAFLLDQFSFATRIIAVSEFVKGHLVRFGINPDRISVVRNGVAAGPTHEDAVRARCLVRTELDIPDDARLAILPSRFARNKRHDVAIECMAGLTAAGRPSYLLCVGDLYPGDRAWFGQLGRLVQQRRVAERVRFGGFRRHMSDVYAAADVLLLPSEDDPLPLVVAEAMAAGVPVVAASSGGIPEMIEDGISGVLVRPGDVDGFVAAVDRVFTDSGYSALLAVNAQERYRREFTLTAFLSRVMSVYLEVGGGERPVASLPVRADRA